LTKNIYKNENFLGSNIFDVTVGLPLPWFIMNLISGETIKVQATGMFCSIGLVNIIFLAEILILPIYSFGTENY